MRIAFRADASRTIGSGHVARCLTLARRLARDGHDCRFVSRALPGDLIRTVRDAGFPVTVLDRGEAGEDGGPEAMLPDWRPDADGTAAALDDGVPWDWLVVDHYGLEAHWEDAVRPCSDNLLVVTDLTDRDHRCTALLDQTPYRQPADYAGRVNPDARLLLGADHALLRDQFAAQRARLARRFDRPRKRLLVSLGGVDRDNGTGAILTALGRTDLPAEADITVVKGGGAPWLDDVCERAAALGGHCRVRVDVADMAALMAAHDLAIGAAGTTSWERCCLGLPTVVTTLAANQAPIARALVRAGAAIHVEGPPQMPATADRVARAARRLLAEPGTMREMSACGMALVDGRGAGRVAAAMTGDGPWI
ncbi:RkpO, polysaccharide biosynthesis protein [Salinisphaera sp. PC39]|uniref:UDP-2,4-diacetamido-2,4, 6-trideoxy-beta-L-altropyranose hydrolase n=1 Tax=Salinisphaera sp. PC39 TaxID=1304156 RepID=UPI00334239BA